MELREKAMLVGFTVPQYSGRKLDKNVTYKIEKMYGTKRKAGRWTKYSIPPEEFKNIEKVASRAIMYNYEQTLPWGQQGQRILPSANYWEYNKQMATFKEEFYQEVDKFLDRYENIKKEAKENLQGMFNQFDYPPKEMVSARFGFRVTITPLPISDDFRVNLGKDETDKIRKEITENVNSSIMEAIGTLWKRIDDAVSHVVERLENNTIGRGKKGKKEKIFHDTLIGNLVDLVNLLPKLNLTNDKNIERIGKEIESKLCSIKPDILRENKVLRQRTKIEAEKILNTIAPYTKGGK